MKPNKKEYNTKSSLSLRIIAGSYLVYIVYSLIRDYGQDKEVNKIFIIGAIIFFSIAATIILITSGLAWIKLNKKDKDEITETKREEIEDNVQEITIQTEENTKGITKDIKEEIREDMKEKKTEETKDI